MEQQVRFCTTSDGVRIAYATVGQGPPLVRILGWLTHLQVEVENPLWSTFIHALSHHFLFVRYDGRGMGLSDRAVKDFSLEANVRDLEAVVDAVGLERVALYGISEGGPAAIAYSVRHPERVSHLILYGSFASFSRAQGLDTEEGRQRFEAMLTLVQQGWGTDLPAYRQLFTSLFMPDGNIDDVRAFNEMQRVSASADNVVALVTALRDTDVSQLLPQVKAPTLVMHCRGDSVVPFDVGRELAAGIPGAHFLPLDGRNHFIIPGEPAGLTTYEAIQEFVGGDGDRQGAPAPSGLVTVLFTDMEGSTTLTQRLGDAKAQEVLRAHNSIVRDALKACGGSEIKHTGDGIMASFPSASRALECAIAVQRAFEEYNAALLRQAQDAHTEPVEVRVRIGLNAGEPIEEEKDLFGTAVQLAARICARAEPGQILVPTVVRELAAGKGFLLADLGEVALRGFEDPVRLYEVRWREPA
jgi:class 3 adenylate cyclase/pimeloyl-ACP methyl ester carboxylesterase